MGIVFGKVDVAEPAFSVLLSRSSAIFPYEVRSYGTRFAIETLVAGETTDKEDTRKPFMDLAGYIGVMSDPQNEGKTAIAMTAPVVMETEKKGEKIAMTDPVVMEETQDKRKMQFILPAEYDEISKIPKPTNPNVSVKEVPPSVGVVHRFSGSFDKERCKDHAVQLVKQINEDGVAISEEEAMRNYQYWGYNPPFTIPFLRRNEVWIELTKTQVDDLKSKFEMN